MRRIDPGTLVIRTYAPARRWFLIGGLALLSLIALYFTYELGRFNAGHDRFAASRERSQLRAKIEQIEKTNRELRTRLAELDTIRIGQARERAEVSRTIGELQAQVARQAQELAFYQGIVTQGATTDATAPGVKIQQMRIVSGGDPGRFRVRLTLVRSARSDNVVSGSIALAVEGESNGKPASLELAALTDDKKSELPFRFRYFENFEQELLLPPDFQPERLTVEVRSRRKGVAPLSQTFLWTVDAL